MDKRLFRILLILSLLSAAGGLILYPRLPDVVPTHWNSYGQVDGHGPKYITLVLLSVPFLLTVGLRFLPVLDPRGRNYRKSPRAYNIIAAVIVLSLIAMGWFTYLPGLGVALPVDKLIAAAIGVMFIGLGNFMPQVRSNFFLGIRTPWALSNETVWRKTHRAGGIVFCLTGILMILSVFFPAGLLQKLPIAFVLLAMIGVYIYSYLVYKRLPR